jgi:hypothetical protein
LAYPKYTADNAAGKRTSVIALKSEDVDLAVVYVEELTTWTLAYSQRTFHALREVI